MSNKQLVIEAVREMPDEATLEEIVDELALLAAIRQGRQDIRAGRFLSHEEMKKQATAWAGN
jgi:predicted transcriptional regulator